MTEPHLSLSFSPLLDPVVALAKKIASTSTGLLRPTPPSPPPWCGANHSSRSPILYHRRNLVLTHYHGRAQPIPPRVRVLVSPLNCFFPDLVLAMARCRALRSVPPWCGGVVLLPPCAPSNGSVSTASPPWSYGHGRQVWSFSPSPSTSQYQ